MLDPNDIVKIFMANTIGESILIETLRSAAYFVSRSSNGFRPKYYREKNLFQEAGACYYFLQGTGLDLLIQRFDLGYNPENLRDIFNYYVRRTS